MEKISLRDKKIAFCRGCLACQHTGNFPKAALAGTVFAGGVDKIGEAEGHPALEKAYQAGCEA